MAGASNRLRGASGATYPNEVDLTKLVRTVNDRAVIGKYRSLKLNKLINGVENRATRDRYIHDSRGADCHAGCILINCYRAKIAFGHRVPANDFGCDSGVPMKR